MKPGHTQATPGRPSAPGHKFRYSPMEFLGRGSFGEVLKVASVNTGNYLAVKKIKLLPPQSNAHLLLEREVQILSRLRHDKSNIVRYKSAQADQGFIEIIMDLKPGNALDLMAKHPLFTDDPASITGLLHQMLQALDYLDVEGIVHRDIKPENILYSLSQEGYHYQLADFGLANVAGPAKTQAGTEEFKPPELDLSHLS